MLTFACSPSAFPLVSVFELVVPRISRHVFPRSQEFFSTASMVSFEVRECSIVARSSLLPSALSSTATIALYLYFISQLRVSCPRPDTRSTFLLSVIDWVRVYFTVPDQPPLHFAAAAGLFAATLLPFGSWA